jgi:hypothetical protein
MINGIIIGNDEIKRTYLIHLIDQYSDLDIIENTDSLKNLQNSIQNYSIDFIFLFDDFNEIDVFDLVRNRSYYDFKDTRISGEMLCISQHHRLLDTPS